jgi:hypothetical protein
MDFQVARWAMEIDQWEVSYTSRGAVMKVHIFQVGNGMGSLEDLIECQESRIKISSFQVGKGSEGRLF